MGFFKTPKNPRCIIIINIHTNYMIFTAYFQNWDPKKKLDLDSLAVFDFGHF
jgi:hypothetical protein